jgi:capsular polysaccharide transport system permease protein
LGKQKRDYLEVFFSVQRALFLRELNMRFSTHKLGLFWTFFEPFFYVSMLIFIKVVLFGRDSEEFDWVVFLALSYIAFLPFKNIINRSLGAFNANKGLFVHKQVKPIDTILARIMVELFIATVILVIFIVLGFYFEFDLQVENLILVMLGYGWFILFSIGLAIFVSVLYSFIPSIKNIMAILMIVLHFSSALFYTVDMLSPELRTWILYNPVVHFIEMIHGNFFYTLNDVYVDYFYMVLWTLLPLYAGLWLYKKIEYRILSL